MITTLPARIPRADLNACRFNLGALHQAIVAARDATENARSKCLIAGQMLNEVQAALPHGEFQPWIEKYLPEIPYRTAARWSRAAANIEKALPEKLEVVIDIEAVTVSAVLTMPDAELTAEQRRYKQAWFDFTNGRTIKECLDGVFVDGDEAHRVDRAVNGMIKGGVGSPMAANRKDVPFHVAKKLKEMGEHLLLFDKLDAGMRSETEQVIRCAILGDDVRIRKVLFQYSGAVRRGRKKSRMWPKAFCQVALKALQERLRLNDEE
jgi:hypothetical protein